MKLYMKHDHYKESSLYGLASLDLLKGKKERENKYVTSNKFSISGATKWVTELTRDYTEILTIYKW